MVFLINFSCFVVSILMAHIAANHVNYYQSLETKNGLSKFSYKRWLTVISALLFLAWCLGKLSERPESIEQVELSSAVAAAFYLFYCIFNSQKQAKNN